LYLYTKVHHKKALLVTKQNGMIQDDGQNLTSHAP